VKKQMLKFTKMHGAGNDFVMLDNRLGDLRIRSAAIQRLCDRHRGVGADGVLVVEPGDKGAEFRMRYYNADGGEVEMCGNGARCFARFVRRIGGPRDEVSFVTNAGVITARFVNDSVELAMSEPKDLRLNQSLPLKLEMLEYHFVNTGVPHVVTFVDDIESVAVERLGAQIRYHEQFAPQGTNANFVQKIDERTLAIRTYERGVEAETLACGTGVVAGALIFYKLIGAKPPISVRVKGGDTMQVNFDAGGDSFENVRLIGPAEIAFEGEIEL
jgi:diaminopimelate epimerase